MERGPVLERLLPPDIGGYMGGARTLSGGFVVLSSPGLLSCGFWISASHDGQNSHNFNCCASEALAYLAFLAQLAELL